jgi:hypothetical protein
MTPDEPRTEPPDDEFPEAPEDGDDESEDDGFCLTCLESFRYDDCGGYNPPCECGFHCRSCHEREDDDDYERDYDDYPEDDE